MPTLKFRTEEAEVQAGKLERRVVNLLRGSNFEEAALVYANLVRLRRRFRLDRQWLAEAVTVDVLRRNNPARRDYLEGKLRRPPAVIGFDPRMPRTL